MVIVAMSRSPLPSTQSRLDREARREESGRVAPAFAGSRFSAEREIVDVDGVPETGGVRDPDPPDGRAVLM